MSNSNKKLLNIRVEFLLSMFLVLMLLSVYWRVNGYEYVNFDDEGYIVKNVNIYQGITKKNVIWALTSTYASNWHPLTWLSHMFDVELYGMNFGAHHMTNVFFHILNTLLLLICFNRLTGALWKSFFLAFLFAFHPLHVESVAWLSERKDVLSTFFWLLTMLSYIWYAERPSINRYFPVILFFILGLLSKPMLVTLPFVLLLLDYWPLGRLFAEQRNRKPVFMWYPLLIEKLPLFGLSIVSCIITFIVQQHGRAVATLEIFPIGLRFANILLAYLNYIVKMIWPVNLVIFYPYPTAVPLYKVFIACVCLIAICLLAVKWVRKYPYFMVGWLWYLGTLVPVIGIVQVGAQSMADRYTYIPLIGLFVITCWGIPDLICNWRYKKIIIFLAAVTIMPVLMLMTWKQISYWENSISLFEHTLKVIPDNHRIRYNYANYLLDKGKNNEAIKQYYITLKTDSKNWKVHNNLATALKRSGQFPEAITHYQEALRIRPNFVNAYYNLGLVYICLGDKHEAKRQFQQALQKKPDYIKPRIALEVLSTSQGQAD